MKQSEMHGQVQGEKIELRAKRVTDLGGSSGIGASDQVGTWSQAYGFGDPSSINFLKSCPDGQGDPRFMRLNLGNS